jgi:hypothetical protein
VAEGVVVGLEAVEVEEAERAGPSVVAGHGEVVEQLAPVGQAALSASVTAWRSVRG